MRIISNGKLFEDSKCVIFTCPNCGCKFSAADDEYYRDTTWNQSQSLTYTFTNIFKVLYHANCPECHKMCSVSRESESAFYTVTCGGKTITTDRIDITCCGHTEGEVYE